MEWTDEGMLLTVRKHGEGSAIIDIFTKNHGRHAGVVRGGGSRKSAALLQPGTQLDVVWRARLEEHLGSFNVEPKFSRTTNILETRVSVTGFAALAALLSTGLAEREAHQNFYLLTMDLVGTFLPHLIWLQKYVRWELQLLNEIGFGLDLTGCAVTGADTDLAFVSPKSGRAVSRGSAIGWESKLLKLPDLLSLQGLDDPSKSDILNALALTGFFLSKAILAATGRHEMPAARDRFIRVLMTKSGQ